MLIIVLIGTDGGSIETQYAVTSDYPAQFVRNNADLSDPISGSNESERAFLLMPYDTSFSPSVTDVVTNDLTSEKYFIEG